MLDLFNSNTNAIASRQDGGCSMTMPSLKIFKQVSKAVLIVARICLNFHSAHR